MKLDEKACPQCAEAIKKSAIVCRYCGHRFSPDEVVEIEADNKKKVADEERANQMALGCAALIVIFAVCFIVYANASYQPSAISKPRAEWEVDPSKYPFTKVKINERHLSVQGHLLAGKLTIKNGNDYEVKNIGVQCSIYSASGEEIEKLTEVAYVTIPPNKSVVTDRMVFGFFNSQARRFLCRAISAERDFS